MRKRGFWTFALGAFLLAACSRTPVETVDPFEPFTTQEVSWGSCDAQLYDEEIEFLEPIVNRLECATLQTPLSWDDPGRDSVNLGVLRVRAPNPTTRKGAIFLNPGGPGGDGLFLAALFGFIFDSAERFGDPSGESLKALSDTYDILGFSPRGVGESFRLYCGSNKLLPGDVNYYDTSEENLDKLLLGSRYIAEACQANPLTKYVDTEQTVRDMDLIRHLLGDEKLNFLGYSYGSWLGAWYAKTFPEHSGNIVLDANTEFSATFKDVFELQPLGFNRAFKDVALAYAARNSGVYNLGATKEEIFNVFLALPDEIKEAFTFGFSGVLGDLYSSFAVPEVGFKLMAARGVTEVLTALGDVPDFGTLQNAVLTYPYSDDEEVNERVAWYASDIAFYYYFFSLEASPSPVELPSSSALFQAITCNDTPWPNDPAVYKAAAREAAITYPLFGVALAQQPCAFWSEPTTSKPDVPADLPPILMVQTGFDAATPAEGALRAFESLPDAHLVFIENEMSHTAFPYGEPCVDEKVAAYLLTGALPSERVSNCEARPLPGEAQVYPPGGGVSPQAASFSLQAALHPTSGNPLYDQVHELIRENAADFYGHTLRDEREQR